MSSKASVEIFEPTSRLPSVRSHSVQGLAGCISSPTLNIPLPPRTWFTDVSNESSEEDESNERDNEVKTMERSKVRARYRHHIRLGASVPIGIFWDIENCQVPKGCSAIDVVSAIRAKFLTGRREADFVVVCDVRKETAHRLQELNDAQVSLIHVCGTQKNAADEKLRQCMRRYGELHSTPAALLLISGDINFAADLSDFRHRKGLEVILVHKRNTSNALIACASSHYCFNELTSQLARNTKVSSYDGDDEPACMVEVVNLPTDQPPMRVARRLRRLADNCGGRVMHISANTATMKFPTPDHASRAAKRMDAEDVFGHKIGTRYSPNGCPLPPVPSYSSDEGYSTASIAAHTMERAGLMTQEQESALATSSAMREWALALQQLPAPTPPPLEFCPPPAPKPRKIRGTHGSNLDQSGCSSSNSGDRETSQSRAMSPWNSSASYSSEGELESTAELTVSNLPLLDAPVLQRMLMQLFSQYVSIIKVSVWMAGEGPLATVVLRSEWDARLAIARIHKRRLDNQWTQNGRRLELSLGRPSPAPNLDILRARLRAILLDQHNYTLPLLRLRDAYASRHCCALTTSDIAKVRDTIVIHEGLGRMVQLINVTPVSSVDVEDAPWKCHVHAAINTCQEDGSRILQPVYMESSVIARNTQVLLENHGGILPALSFVECYEATFPPLVKDVNKGVPLELLLRSVPGVVIRESPSRHVTWGFGDREEPPGAHGGSGRWCGGPRTAPALEPMLALLERELLDLLRVAPRCTIQFSKLIPTFHHHFGRQCRVADYGFTKLPDLLAALSNTIVVLGSGSSRVITISAAAQTRRWTTDLVKMLKTQPGRAIYPHEVPQLYQTTLGQIFSPADYGVCTLEELMQRVNSQAVIISPEGAISLPRRTPTPDERARTAHFSVQAVELLCNTSKLCMEFSRFVPAYHAHFGHQLRVAHYGCVKLAELFELIPEVVTVSADEGGERIVRLALRPARAVMGERLRAIAPVQLTKFPAAYAARYGSPPLANALNTSSLEELVFAAGGCVEDGIVRAPGSAPRWVSAILAACAVLSADRSIARGSTEEYFTSAFRRMVGVDAELKQLVAAGVTIVSDKRVRLTPIWRAVWRVAQILVDSKEPLNPIEICVEYSKRYEPAFSCVELGFESLVEFLQYYREVFSCVVADGRWTLAAGVNVARCTNTQPTENYSVYDTPPGQKGSRVFESPTNNIWCSPPASALPTPAFLIHENKRRTRLAAQFDAA